MKITAVIPIRSGSQRVKDKNLRRFGDTTLMELKIKRLLQVPELDSIIVNTNSKEAISIVKNIKTGGAFLTDWPIIVVKNITPVANAQAVSSSSILVRWQIQTFLFIVPVHRPSSNQKHFPSAYRHLSLPLTATASPLWVPSRNSFGSTVVRLTTTRSTLPIRRTCPTWWPSTSEWPSSAAKTWLRTATSLASVRSLSWLPTSKPLTLTLLSISI